MTTKLAEVPSTILPTLLLTKTTNGLSNYLGQVSVNDMKNKRTEEIVRLFTNRVPIAEIARMYGFSRQRASQIIKPFFAQTGRKPQWISNAVNSTPSEKLVFKLIRRKGIEVVAMPQGHPYDAKINGKKVEIKYSSKPKDFKRKGYVYSYYSFINLKDRVDVDFYIFVCGKLSDFPRCYVFPAKKVGKSFTMPENIVYEKVSNKYDSSLENWRLIK